MCFVLFCFVGFLSGWNYFLWIVVVSSTVELALQLSFSAATNGMSFWQYSDLYVFWQWVSYLNYYCYAKSMPSSIIFFALFKLFQIKHVCYLVSKNTIHFVNALSINASNKLMMIHILHILHDLMPLICYYKHPS